jgi:hypothetical protein
MMILAKIVYWLLSITLLVVLAYGQDMPGWWVHALSLALLAVSVWFVGWLFRYFVRRVSITAPSQATPKSMA